MPLLNEPEISRSDFDRLAQAIYQHCGINLTEGKVDLVRARLAKRLRSTGHRDYGSYIDDVLGQRDGDEFLNLIDSLSTNLTSFFRESQHFDYLAATHLPRVIKRNAGTRRIRGWNAGCSSGEEPYTTAIVLRETLPSLGADRWDVKLLATDISTRVLKKAVAGVYAEQQIKTVPPAMRGTYFEPRARDGESCYVVHPSLRSMIVFNRLNLMEAWPFSGPFDWIFCRNVMIYFDKPTQEKLVNRYHSLLAPGGVLFTGHSESLTGIKHPFKFVQATIYQKAD
jgi:chemotaxis protein methyltransferase CheR